MKMKDTDRLILENVEDTLILAGNELLTQGSMNQRTIDQLEYEYEQLKKVDLDSISEDDARRVVDRLNSAQLIIKKHREITDNTTLMSVGVMLTPRHIHFLDEYARKHFKGISQGSGRKKSSGNRSAALRDILDTVMENQEY